MDDAWYCIFHYLSPIDLLNCRLVSQQLNLIVKREFLRRKRLNVLDECPEIFGIPCGPERIIDFYGSSLQEVVFHVPAKTERFSICPSEHHVTTEFVRRLLKNAVNLKVLKFQRLNLTIGAMEQLASLPSTLEVLSLISCSFSCDSFDLHLLLQRIFAQIFENCKQLKEFTIQGRGYSYGHFVLNSQLLSRLPKRILRLGLSPGKSLELNNLKFLEHMRLNSLSVQRSQVADLSPLLPMKDTLKELDLSFSNDVSDFTLIGKLYQLRELNLSGCRDGMTDIALIEITSGCHFIEHFSLENCVMLTKSSLCKIGHLSHLEWLNVAGITAVDDDVAECLSACSKLQFLDANFCTKLTSNGITTLLRMPSLRDIDFNGIPALSQQLLNSKRNVQRIAHGYFPVSMPPLIPPIPSAAPA